ncbi:hypothetical protein AJ87_11300 [Rhizobium yanglingense]|nr:hypothetical protein AJ87_11300 [Rhizobium yanglingense]
MRMSIVLRAKGGKADFPFLRKAPIFANGAYQFRTTGALRLTQCVRPFAMFADRLYPPARASCGIVAAGHRGLCPKCGRRALHRAALWRSAGSAVSAEAIANPPPFDRLRSVAAHDHAVGDLAHGLKYRDRTDLAPMMAGWMLRASDGMIGACDVLVPIPLHRSRMLSRKFNQTAELARKARSFGGRAPWSSRF